MTKNSGGATINQGSHTKPTQEESAAKFDITGNVVTKGQKPSPGNRDRGEASDADPARGIDINTAESRALARTWRVTVGTARANQGLCPSA